MPALAHARGRMTTPLATYCRTAHALAERLAEKRNSHPQTTGEVGHRGVIKQRVLDAGAEQAMRELPQRAARVTAVPLIVTIEIGDDDLATGFQRAGGVTQIRQALVGRQVRENREERHEVGGSVVLRHLEALDDREPPVRSRALRTCEVDHLGNDVDPGKAELRQVCQLLRQPRPRRTRRRSGSGHRAALPRAGSRAGDGQMCRGRRPLSPSGWRSPHRRAGAASCA